MLTLRPLSDCLQAGGWYLEASILLRDVVRCDDACARGQSVRTVIRFVSGYQSHLSNERLLFFISIFHSSHSSLID